MNDKEELELRVDGKNDLAFRDRGNSWWQTERRSDNVRCMRALEAAQNPEEMLKEQWVVFQVKYKDVVGLSVAWSPSSGLVLCVLHRCHQPGPHVR